MHVLAWVAIGLAHITIVASSLQRLSPTELEPPCVVSSVALKEHGAYDVYKVSPPCIKWIGALLLINSSYRQDWRDFERVPGNRPEFDTGRRFFAINGHTAISLLNKQRLTSAILSAIIVLLAFFSLGLLIADQRSLFVAACLVLFDPNYIANSSLFTNDAIAATTGFAAIVAFLYWLRKHNWITAFIAGLLLGIAEASKFTWILLYPLFIVIWLFEAVVSRDSKLKRRFWRNQILQIAAMFMVSIYIINLFYCFSSTCLPLQSFLFVSESLSGDKHGHPGNTFLGTPYQHIIVPLPMEYVLGIDLQKKDFEKFALDSYLEGVWQSGGGWYTYYFYGILNKVPHLSQFVILAGVIFPVSRILLPKRPWNVSFRGFASTSLLIIATSLFVFVSSQNEFSIHFRYILPCLILFYAVGVHELLSASFIRSRGPFEYFLVVFSFFVCITSHRSHIPYFNELSGGVTNGWRHLLGSSYDWGQDIFVIRDYLEDNHIPISEVRLDYHGYFYWECIYPEIQRPQKGLFKYALVSANTLTRPEMPWLKRLDAGEGIRICNTAWLFPIQD